MPQIPSDWLDNFDYNIIVELKYYIMGIQIYLNKHSFFHTASVFINTKCWNSLPLYRHYFCMQHHTLFFLPERRCEKLLPLVRIDPTTVAITIKSYRGHIRITKYNRINQNFAHVQASCSAPVPSRKPSITSLKYFRVARILSRCEYNIFIINKC